MMTAPAAVPIPSAIAPPSLEELGLRPESESAGCPWPGLGGDVGTFAIEPLPWGGGPLIVTVVEAGGGAEEEFG